MSIRLVDSSWQRELHTAASCDASELRIICPFIKEKALVNLVEASNPVKVQAITRFNLADVAAGVSDLESLRLLLNRNAAVRGIKNLHAKMYIFGKSRAIVTSANLTEAALKRNHEFGFVSDDPSVVNHCLDYFEKLWKLAKSDLAAETLSKWEEQVTDFLASGAKPALALKLPDLGVDIGLTQETPAPMPLPIVQISPTAEATQSFVKFLGESHNRRPPTFPTIDEIKRAGCHWALAYPESKRPRKVEDGALFFIGRMSSDPNDIRIFGRAIGMKYIEGRDDATPADIALREWKKVWPRYIRIHHAEFLSGTLENGISLNELMDTLGSLCFAATKRNEAKGTGNVDPRGAYRQQAQVELSTEGKEWMNSRFENAMFKYGKVPQEQLDKLDWPEVPSGYTGVK